MMAVYEYNVINLKFRTHIVYRGHCRYFDKLQYDTVFLLLSVICSLSRNILLFFYPFFMQIYLVLILVSKTAAARFTIIVTVIPTHLTLG
jgi:uncharacterized membrane protein YqhA